MIKFLFLRISKDCLKFFLCKNFFQLFLFLLRHDPPGVVYKAETGIEDAPPIFSFRLSDPYIKSLIFSCGKGAVSIDLVREIGRFHTGSYRIGLSLALYGFCSGIFYIRKIFKNPVSGFFQPCLFSKPLGQTVHHNFFHCHFQLLILLTVAVCHYMKTEDFFCDPFLYLPVQPLLKFFFFCPKSCRLHRRQDYSTHKANQNCPQESLFIYLKSLHLCNTS